MGIGRIELFIIFFVVCVLIVNAVAYFLPDIGISFQSTIGAGGLWGTTGQCGCVCALGSSTPPPPPVSPPPIPGGSFQLPSWFPFFSSSSRTAVTCTCSSGCGNAGTDCGSGKGSICKGPCKASGLSCGEDSDCCSNSCNCRHVGHGEEAIERCTCGSGGSQTGSQTSGASASQSQTQSSKPSCGCDGGKCSFGCHNEGQPCETANDCLRWGCYCDKSDPSYHHCSFSCVRETFACEKDTDCAQPGCMCQSGICFGGCTNEGYSCKNVDDCTPKSCDCIINICTRGCTYEGKRCNGPEECGVSTPKVISQTPCSCESYHCSAECGILAGQYCAYDSHCFVVTQ